MSDRHDPFLRTLVEMLRDTTDVTSFDRLLLDISRKAVIQRAPWR